jgi:hypothetical protein
MHLMQLKLWSYPDTSAPPLTVRTMHLANIFGVRFLPCAGDARLVSGAMDCCVQLHTLDALPTVAAAGARAQRSGAAWQPRGPASPVTVHTTKYLCHRKRVKVKENGDCWSTWVWIVV